MSNSLDPDQVDILSDLIWVQTVCKSYKQMTLEVKELKDGNLTFISILDFDCEFLINNSALDLSKKGPAMTVVKAEPTIKSEAMERDPIHMTSTATPTILTRTFTVTKQQPTIILTSSHGQTALSERSVLPKITVKQEPPDVYDVLEPSGA